MRQHLGILLVLIFLALAAGLAWELIDHSVPGYRSIPTHHSDSRPRGAELL